MEVRLDSALKDYRCSVLVSYNSGASSSRSLWIAARSSEARDDDYGSVCRGDTISCNRAGHLHQMGRKGGCRVNESRVVVAAEETAKLGALFSPPSNFRVTFCSTALTTRFIHLTQTSGLFSLRSADRFRFTEEFGVVRKERTRCPPPCLEIETFPPHGMI